VESELPAGAQTLRWDGRDQQGQTVASGVYFYELVVGNKVERKKMMLIR
jgi:flagellar hook assembly protein FlgD